MSSLDGRVAIVTGANSGIGRAICELFARHGADVIGVDRTPGFADRAPDGVSRAVVCDVADEASVEQCYASIATHADHVDILVNSAGIARRGSVISTPLFDWNALFATNVTGAWLMCRRALPLMQQQRSGAIVNIASAAGLRPIEGFAAYGASKAALISLTRSIALEVGSAGIRANCLCPGIIDTPMNVGARGVTPGQPADLASMLEPYPLGRIGRPEEVAEAALFLASDAASFVTGAALAVDAGRTLH